MSELFDNIPTHRQEQYLANAEAAFNEAVEPVVEAAILDLGKTVVSGAEDLTKRHADAIAQVHSDADDFARAREIGDQAEAYASEHDMTKKLREDLDTPGVLDRMDLASKLRRNPSRGDINPVGIRDFDLFTGLGKALEANASNAPHSATPMKANGQRPEVSGATFKEIA